MSRELWIRADIPESRDARKELVISALESGICTAIVRPGDEDLGSLGKVRLYVNDGGSLSGNVELVELRTPEDQERAMQLAGKRDAVILDPVDWAVIPLENMIARFRGSGTRVLACAGDIRQAELYLQTLEKGVDGIVITTDDPDSVRRFSDMLGGDGGIPLEVLKVLETKNIGMGDRVCVDTVSSMVPGEGMLIGSQASCLFLVQSESEESGYVAARPFRVNAGAVHAYILTPEGRTRYLSELRSGDPLTIVDAGGTVRTSSVGRCKVERRPMLLVRATDGDDEYTTILQNAETVKLVGPDGAVSVSDLKEGDRVYARLEHGGRHFGMRIEETIREI